jgi:hypothetical protein
MARPYVGLRHSAHIYSLARARFVHIKHRPSYLHFQNFSTAGRLRVAQGRYINGLWLRKLITSS